MDVASVQRMQGKTALVLSAGGMFAAYQAGVWKAIAGAFRPDMVIGASAGALNGWAIAGGCPPEELAARWTDPDTAKWMRFRAPGFDARVQELFTRYSPRMPFGVVVVEAASMRSRLMQADEITWRHLAASCSIPVIFPAQRIGAKRYIDGGLLNVLPLWAAREMGATRVIAINAMPAIPNPVLRVAAEAMRWIRPQERMPVEGMDVIHISPSEPLGSLWELVRWKRDCIERWIDVGYRDGQSITMRLYAELSDLSPEGDGAAAFPGSAPRLGNG
jgi:NTE family protein